MASFQLSFSVLTPQQNEFSGSIYVKHTQAKASLVASTYKMLAAEAAGRRISLEGISRKIKKIGDYTALCVRGWQKRSRTVDFSIKQ